MITIRVIVSVYLLSLLYAWFADSSALWGIYHLTFLPAGDAWFLIFIASVVLWLPQRTMTAIKDAIDHKLSPFTVRVITWSSLILMIMAFFFVRSRTLVLGDSCKLLTQITEPLIFIPTEQLNLTILSNIYRLTGSPVAAFVSVSLIAGVIFVIITYRTIASLTSERVGIVAGMGLVLGLAQVQFFFGYVENYALMTAFVSLFLFFGLISQTRRVYVWWSLVAFIAASVFHMSALFLMPGLIYLLWNHGNSSRDRSAFRLLSVVIFLAVAVGGVVFYTRYQGNEVFCPLLANDQNPYSLLSIQHLTDVVNLLLLIAPLPAMLVVAAVPRILTGEISKRRGLTFLAACTAGGLVLLLSVDPKLGAVRDWDLMSLYGLPLAILAAAICLGGKDRYLTSPVLLQVVIAVLLAHTIPWILSNTKPVDTYDHVKRVVSKDIHYTPSYYEGDRLMSWGIMAVDQFGDFEERRRCFKQRLTVRPDDHRSWLYYARSCYKLGQIDAARNALQFITDLDLLTESQLERLADLQLKLGETAQARATLDYYSQNCPENFLFLYLMGLAYRNEGENGEAAKFFERAMTLEPVNIELLLNYAATAIDMANPEKADSLIRAAEESGLLNEQDRAFLARLKELLPMHR